MRLLNPKVVAKIDQNTYKIDTQTHRQKAHAEYTLLTAYVVLGYTGNRVTILLEHRMKKCFSLFLVECGIVLYLLLKICKYRFIFASVFSLHKEVKIHSQREQKKHDHL